ncbi:hypothetical protein DC094_19230 [Pelagibaculum spongiae]|uniref:Uncharacterized protein n=1 Tax=Pelagibaculum spongiae TaxID=2080658 RepID=A0A2V1GRH0_9GAMM|nr:hypothetical protein DC094_19230 [Pelagibaculum spongiae]
MQFGIFQECNVQTSVTLADTTIAKERNHVDCFVRNKTESKWNDFFKTFSVNRYDFAVTTVKK